MLSPIIDVQNLSKVYPVAMKDPGLMGTLRHFVKRQYKEIPAVKPLSFSIYPGEMVGFLGPNGAGKTTTLKMLAGLLHPSGGQARVAGFTPFDRAKPFLQQITLVMGQKQQLIWDLPAMDSLRINAAIYEISDQERDRRIGELAEMLSLGEELRQPVRKLSLGQRMKAELLAALLHRPRVLFLDEPTLGLDINAQVAVRKFLGEWRERFGCTVLLTSHYMADIEVLCERVVVIHEGQLIYDGGLAKLVEQFAPWREVRVELGEEKQSQELASYGDVQSVEGRSVRFLVPRESLTRSVSRMLSELPILDLTVSDPPVEEVIGRVFSSGRVS